MITKLIHESGNDTLRDFGWQHDVKHFLIFDGPNVQFVNVGINSNAGYTVP